jgi:ATP-dependent helicase HrpB
VELLEGERNQGNILAFLPGAAEIRRAARECDSIARQAGLLVLPLHGDLTPAEQDRAVLPSAERKLILATNVAESSVTVEGVNAVIDSGLARMATHSPWTGLPTLEIGRVSKASCTQRVGRAGRMGPGQAIRLRALKIGHPADLEWLDAPPPEAVSAAESLLDRLGAGGERVGQLSQLPLHPRLARIVLEAIERGVGEDGCRAAAMLGLGLRTEPGDLLAVLDRPPDPRLNEYTRQLIRLAHPPRQKGQNDDELLLSVLTGFPDRVARRRSGNQVVLSTGVAAEIAGQLPSSEFLLALDAEDRRESPLPLVRLTARIEPEWLLELFPERIEERSVVEWNAGSERVERIRSLLYDRLLLEESRGNASHPEAAELLARKVLEAGIESFVDQDALEQFLLRVNFAGIEPPDAAALVRNLCDGLHSFAEFKEAARNFVPLLEQKANSRLLAELAPTVFRLAGGRNTKIHYEQGRPPWIASRLQDFFGMQDTPRIGRSRTPLVIHLLAPNQRAVQTTTDLAGFWQRLYPQVRRELMRRYPRHAWPEKPG